MFSSTCMPCNAQNKSMNSASPGLLSAKQRLFSWSQWNKQQSCTSIVVTISLGYKSRLFCWWPAHFNYLLTIYQRKDGVFFQTKGCNFYLFVAAKVLNQLQGFIYFYKFDVSFLFSFYFAYFGFSHWSGDITSEQWLSQISCYLLSISFLPIVLITI